MTTQTDQPVIDPAPVLVTPKANSRLEQLHALYADAKAAADDADEKLKAITDGIKAELTRAAPEQPRIELTGQAGPPLRLSYSETWRFDSRRFKSEDPATYVRYAKKSGSWTLKVASQGGGE